jgi:hypothetical protein
MVGGRGFEPRASWAQGSCHKSIFFVPLAWIYTSSHSPKFLGAYGSFFPNPLPNILNVLVL